MDYPNGKKKDNPCWADLQLDILGRIHSKLYLADQIRFCAVCRNWKTSSSGDIASLRCHYNIPWIVKHGAMWSTGDDVYPFPSKLFDPYSKSVLKLSSFSRPKKYPADCYDQTTAYASKYNGWVLFSHQRDALILPRKTRLFLRNVFTNKVILLPELDLECKAATFTGNPPECTVLVLGTALCSSCCNSADLRFAYYCLQKGKTWTGDFVHRKRSRVREREDLELKVCSVLYMEGRLYYIDNARNVKIYNLLESGNCVTEHGHGDELVRSSASAGCWLFEGDGKDLVMLGRSVTNEWSIWKLDRLLKKWVAETEPKHDAYFISGKVSFSAPLSDVGGEDLDGCRVYYERKGSIECYSFLERRNVQSNLYSWVGKLDDGKICFVQPPC